MSASNDFYSSGSLPNYSSIDADMDMYFDFNQGQGLQTPSTIKSPTSTTSSMHRPFGMENASKKQVFGGPSHEYGRFKQQTGLPNGAVSNVVAYNEMSNDFESSSDFGQVSDGFNHGPLDQGYNTGMNMDMDFAGPSNNVNSYMFLEGGSLAFDELIDPTAVADSAPPANRPYPGMHSQQAQEAKAQAMAKKEEQQMQGQHIMQQRMQHRQSVSSTRSSVSQQGGHRKSSATPTDPYVEESISRVLDNMRHSTVAPIDEEDEDIIDSGIRTGKQRKDEEDMDEDERLLASEEGKKLTSKERRQLRNKVSARAFRSRRKEYISQLEGEVAAKMNECNDLKAQNRNLMDQNSQLTRLTQTLLRHPAFSTFLEDMSHDPSILATLQAQAGTNIQQSQDSSQQQEQQNEEMQANDGAEENNTQVGMALMPQTSLNLSMLNLGNGHWGSSNTQFNFQQPQVFSVLELPQGPPIDSLLSSNLSGKSEDVSEPAKVEYPIIKSLDVVDADKSKTLPSPLPVLSRPVDESSGSLYDDAPPSTSSTSDLTLDEAARMLECSLSGKQAVHYTVNVLPSVTPEAAMQRINQLFDALEPTRRRIESLTSHLPSR